MTVIFVGEEWFNAFYPQIFFEEIHSTVVSLISKINRNRIEINNNDQ